MSHTSDTPRYQPIAVATAPPCSRALVLSCSVFVFVFTTDLSLYISPALNDTL